MRNLEYFLKYYNFSLEFFIDSRRLGGFAFLFNFLQPTIIIFIEGRDRSMHCNAPLNKKTLQKRQDLPFAQEFLKCNPRI